LRPYPQYLTVQSLFAAWGQSWYDALQAKVERRRKQLEESAARYLAQLDTADRHDPSEIVTLKKMRYEEKLEKLKSEMAKLAAIEKQVLASPDKQVRFTDPDSPRTARSNHH